MAKNRATETAPAPRSFARFLEQLADGETHAEASDKLHELARELEDAAEQRGSASGTLTLKITLSTSGKGMMDVRGAVETKAPKNPSAKGVFWLDDRGNLVTENPRQAKLPLREVTASNDTKDLTVTVTATSPEKVVG